MKLDGAEVKDYTLFNKEGSETVECVFSSSTSVNLSSTFSEKNFNA